MKSKRLLVIGLTWPEPTATAAGVRMVQLLEIFKKYEFETTFVSTASNTEHSQDLEAMGIATHSIKLNDASFDSFIENLQPDIVLFDRFLTEEQFGWRVAEHCPHALRILDSEDLHSLRHARENCFKKGIPFTEAHWLQYDRTKRELASILRSDLTLIISSFEMELLQRAVRLDTSLLWHLPFMYTAISQQNDWPEFEARMDFLFIGGGLHAPNVDAIKHLEQEIWPNIHARISDAKCYIYGAYLPDAVNKLHNPKKGFYVRGRARSVSEVMKMAKVCLAPLRFGAGIKGKLMDAMLNGTPSITTGIGAEGMHGEMNWNGFITYSQDDFIDKAIELYTNKTCWQKAQDNGINIINKLYHKPRLEMLFMDRIKEIMGDLETHRAQNIMGRILEHHTLQSTKYLSKWIEEKNRKE
ncbi:glycosyltransferase [Maribacter algicola]|uniref:Glycosyltransferase n=1 Tax=Maribacter algicola TaxID=2498892 RepID=A0A426RJ61_9FLAO|nr:glycosyltransferase [Maribacter algicola]RRQ49002.1 glycosyltransferase [Maribacter algicola]